MLVLGLTVREERELFPLYAILKGQGRFYCSGNALYPTSLFQYGMIKKEVKIHGTINEKLIFSQLRIYSNVQKKNAVKLKTNSTRPMFDTDIEYFKCSYNRTWRSVALKWPVIVQKSFLLRTCFM